LGTKRGVGRGAFIDSVLGAIDGFYESVLQSLQPWVAKAPQVSKAGSVLAEAGIDTNVLPTEQPEPGTGDESVFDDPQVQRDEITPQIEDAAELVSWDRAEESLDRERVEGVAQEDLVSAASNVASANEDGVAAPDWLPTPNDSAESPQV
jgi:hypothetical protein